VEHLVKFTSAEGRDGFHTAGSLDDALKFVERLRNNEDVDNVRVYRLTEVPISFKAYYKVEISGATETAGGAQPAAPDTPLLEALPTPAPGEDDQDGLAAAPGGDGGRRLFGRS
jgi:hypothetical protein